MVRERVWKVLRVKEVLELDREGQVTVLKNGPVAYKAERIWTEGESVEALGCAVLENCKGGPLGQD